MVPKFGSSVMQKTDERQIQIFYVQSKGSHGLADIQHWYLNSRHCIYVWFSLKNK